MTSVILPVINETFSLTETVHQIERDCSADVRQYLIVVCSKTTAESMEICNGLKESDPSRYSVHHQTLPFLGGAIREAFDLTQTSHVVMMASDLETDPGDVKQLISTAKEHPEAIVTASRWLEEGSFEGYDPLKLRLNSIFQKLLSFVYGTQLSDMTYGYRIFPTWLVKSITWEELRHPFLLETLLKPLRLGVPIYEIPSKWSARAEGESQNTFFRNFEYFRTALKIRISPRSTILKQASPLLK